MLALNSAPTSLRLIPVSPKSLNCLAKRFGPVSGYLSLHGNARIRDREP
jgi:hypothetical protein